MLTIVWQFDPRGKKIGGIGNYVNSFIRQIPSEVDVGLIGVTTNKAEVGKWKKIEIHNREVSFLPVCYVADENKKYMIPLSLRFSFGLFKYRKLFNDNIAFFHQRIEYLLPLYRLSNKQYSLIHFDITQYLDPYKGESYWAKFPFLFNVILKRVLKRLDFMFSVNSNTIGYIQNEFSEYKESIMFAPTWADPSIFSYSSQEHKNKRNAAKDFSIPESSNVIITVGRLNSHKNVELSLDVVEKLESAVLVVVGDGPSKKGLQEKVKLKKLDDKVLFVGRLKQEEIKKLYYIAKVYLSTSNTEGMSVALLESLNMGVPVVTTPTGESTRVVIDGLNGFVSNEWCSDEIAKKIKLILDNRGDFENHQVISSVSNFSAGKIVPKILEKMDV